MRRLITLVKCKWRGGENKNYLYMPSIAGGEKHTESSLAVSLQASKLVHSYMHSLMSAAHSGVRFFRGAGEQVFVLYHYEKTLPRPEEAPTCVCPAVSPVQDEIIHQNCSEETL